MQNDLVSKLFGLVQTLNEPYINMYCTVVYWSPREKPYYSVLNILESAKWFGFQIVWASTDNIWHIY